jgi:hypothetical protein
MDALQVILGLSGFVVLGWFIKIVATAPRERMEEDEARRFFDQHGRWPDEEPPGR